MITNGLAELFGKATKAGKLAAAASVLIDTYRGASAAIASMAGAGPIGWALGAAQAGIIIASGAKSINDIYKVDENGGAVTTPTQQPTPQATARMIDAPNYSTGSNLSSLYSTNAQQNEVAQTIASSQPEPIVKVTDITNMQNSVAVKESLKI
jgi:hypothetical protein